MAGPEPYEGTLAFDNLDIDLILKVASHTIFGPFFTFFVPIIYKGMGAPWTAPTVFYSSAWFLFVTSIWLLQRLSNKYRNSGTPGRLNWGDQIVLITGGSSGIGYLLANTLAIRQVTVVVLDVIPIETENYNITFYKCDVSKWEEVERVAKQIEEEIGHPTVIVNNAGVVQDGKLITELTSEDVNQTLNVNVIGQFNVLRAFLPAIVKEKQGHIITMSSAVGYMACALASDYCASKAASISLHESLRYELDKHHKAPHVRTTLVCPGMVQTKMFSQAKNFTTASPLPKGFVEFFNPSLAPHVIVKAIIAAMDEQESRDISLPAYAQLAPLGRAVPYFVRDVVHWAFGVDHALKGFRKTNGMRPDELAKQD